MIKCHIKQVIRLRGDSFITLITSRELLPPSQTPCLTPSTHCLPYNNKKQINNRYRSKSHHTANKGIQSPGASFRSMVRDSARSLYRFISRVAVTHLIFHPVFLIPAAIPLMVMSKASLSLRLSLSCRNLFRISTCSMLMGLR